MSWIWLPSERTLPNTVVLFRREFDACEATPTGWIVADSRYRLWVNGQRVQWGPSPTDPRHQQRDPVDLTRYLRAGRNVVGVEVLYFGNGDGTWACGLPGLLMDFGVRTDGSWRCRVDPAHAPGVPRRWFLRSLQEKVDLHREPRGWKEVGFDDSQWHHAMELDLAESAPSLVSGYGDYAHGYGGSGSVRTATSLTDRDIPLLQEQLVEAQHVDSARIAWRGEVDDWFDFRTPGLYRIVNDGACRVETYRLPGVECGFPVVHVRARSDAVIHLMTQESHEPDGEALLDTHLYSWSRWSLPAGEHVLEPMDYEGCQWLQLHVQGEVEIDSVALRRRWYPWPHEPGIACSDERVQAVWNAALRTLDNSAQDRVVDGMARERQQYSGDGSHQLHAIRLLRGAPELSARFLTSFGYGMTLHGVFFDSWPGYDRLARLWEKNLGLTTWGPLLDHSIGFVFDHYHHWMQTGDLAPARQNWPALERLLDRIGELAGDDGLIPVRLPDECSVWMDHDAFASDDHKRCALNLYAAAMLAAAAAPLAEALGVESAKYRELAAAIAGRCVERYWDSERQLFVGGREVGDDRVDDRSIATAVIYDFNPGHVDAPSVALLADMAAPIGRSYPANAIWAHWALIKGRRIDAVLEDLRTRWFAMESVAHAGTLQETWHAQLDTPELMSHCAQAPLLSLASGIVGYQPLTPGGRLSRLDPQIGDLTDFQVRLWTPLGPLIADLSDGRLGITVPGGMDVDAVGAAQQDGRTFVWES